MKLYVDQKPKTCSECLLVDSCPFKQLSACGLIELKYRSLVNSLEYDYIIGVLNENLAQEILDIRKTRLIFKEVIEG